MHLRRIYIQLSLDVKFTDIYRTLHPQCPSKDEWIKKMWYMYSMQYYSAIRKDKYPPFASTWMELEGIMRVK